VSLSSSAPVSHGSTRLRAIHRADATPMGSVTAAWPRCQSNRVPSISGRIASATGPISWETLRGGVGVTVAVLTLLFAGSAYVADTGARQMLAIGLLAYGILGIVSLIFTFRSTGFNITSTIADALAMVLGILLLSARSGDTRGTQLLGVAAIRGWYRTPGLLLESAG
jgi:hypothetical protein